MGHYISQIQFSQDIIRILAVADFIVRLGRVRPCNLQQYLFSSAIASLLMIITGLGRNMPVILPCTMGDLRVLFEKRSTVVYLVPDHHVWIMGAVMFGHVLQSERA